MPGVQERVEGVTVEKVFMLVGSVKELNNVIHDPSSGEIPYANPICHSQLLHECLLFVLAGSIQRLRFHIYRMFINTVTYFLAGLTCCLI